MQLGNSILQSHFTTTRRRYDVFFCGLLICFFGSFCGKPAALESASMNDLTMQIVETSPSGGITVQLKNSSKKPVRIWKDSNSWGAARWRVLLIRNGQLETFFQNPDQDFTRNIPTFNEIAVGALMEQKLDLNLGGWLGVDGRKIHFDPNDLIIVIYDVPPSAESLEFTVWHGVVTALTTVRR